MSVTGNTILFTMQSTRFSHLLQYKSYHSHSHSSTQPSRNLNHSRGTEQETEGVSHSEQETEGVSHSEAGSEGVLEEVEGAFLSGLGSHSP